VTDVSDAANNSLPQVTSPSDLVKRQYIAYQQCVGDHPFGTPQISWPTKLNPLSRVGHVNEERSRVPHSFAHFANEWALDLGKTLDGTTLDFRWPLLGLHAHRSRLPIEVGSETAPLPLLGSLDGWATLTGRIAALSQLGPETTGGAPR
jgi:hypothetical protein